MPHNRTPAEAKREEDMTPEELLRVCGPSDAALLHSAQRKAQRDASTRRRRIGRRVRAIRHTQPSHQETP
jgi:hypothetical protein